MVTAAESIAVYDQTTWLWLIIAAPLASSLLLLLVGKRLGGVPAGIVASAAIGVSFAAGIMTFLQLLSNPAGHGAVAGHRSQVVHLWDWISAGSFRVGMDLLIDQLSAVMVLVVTGVGSLIHVYSIGYMRGDERMSRFFAYLNLFAAAMLLLVLADNLLLLYVGWEGVGLCSYLLIGFWFEKTSAHNAAKKAFIVNRVGDFLFLLGIFVVAAAAGSLTLGAVNGAAGAMGAGIATIAGLLLFGGATAKSAQVPLYVWLPDAMEGPTPVSALIHAATMVTAGVYMIARLSPVFNAGDALIVVAWVGAFTALWAGMMAAVEYDIKRVLAYSTVSQLGYMFIAHGVGAYSMGVFHLVTHAFFKALMFLGAGAVMHGLAGETDMRKMGGLRRSMPVTGWTFAVGWLAISGIVPLSGFFSKDGILAAAWEAGEYGLWAAGIAGAGLTAFYMTRLYLRVFEGRSRVAAEVHPHDAPPTMALALVSLALLSAAGGVLNLPRVLTLEHFLEPVVGAVHVPEGIMEWVLSGVAVAVALVGIATAYVLYMTRAAEVRRRRLQSSLRPLVHAAREAFYVDRIYGATIVAPGQALARFAADVVDARWIDGLLTGAGRFVAGLSEGTRRLQTGYVRTYAVTFLLGVVIVLSVLVIRVSVA